MRRAGAVGQSPPHHRCRGVDGRDVLPAAALRLSRHVGAGFPAVGNLQGHGAPAVADHHEPGVNRGLDYRPLSRLGLGHVP